MIITRSLIVAETRGWIGTPYRHQASLKGVGCDCLGLVRGVWRGVIGDEPDRASAYAADWAEAGDGCSHTSNAPTPQSHFNRGSPPLVLPEKTCRKQAVW